MGSNIPGLTCPRSIVLPCLLEPSWSGDHVIWRLTRFLATSTEIRHVRHPHHHNDSSQFFNAAVHFSSTGSIPTSLSTIPLSHQHQPPLNRRNVSHRQQRRRQQPPHRLPPPLYPLRRPTRIHARRLLGPGSRQRPSRHPRESNRHRTPPRLSPPQKPHLLTIPPRENPSPSSAPPSPGSATTSARASRPRSTPSPPPSPASPTG